MIPRVFVMTLSWELSLEGSSASCDGLLLDGFAYYP
jgi:hypothetical protein